MVLTPEEKTLISDWDKAYPVSNDECRRASNIFGIQGNSNGVLMARCRGWLAFQTKLGQAANESMAGNKTRAMAMLKSLEIEYLGDEALASEVRAAAYYRVYLSSEMGNDHAALKIVDLIISRLGKAEGKELQEELVNALATKVSLLINLEQYEDALPVVEEIIERFKLGSSRQTQRSVAYAMREGSYAASSLDNIALERQIEQEIIVLFGDSNHESIQKIVLEAYRFHAASICRDQELADKCAKLIDRVLNQYKHLDDELSQFYRAGMTMELALLRGK